MSFYFPGSEVFDPIYEPISKEDLQPRYLPPKRENKTKEQNPPFENTPSVK